MTLRPYDELAEAANLTSNIPGVSLDSPIGKMVNLAMSNVANKSLQRVLITSIVGWSFFLFFFVFLSDNASSFALMFPLFCIGPIVIAILVVAGFSFLMSTLLDVPEALMTDVLLRRGETLDVQYRQSIKRQVTVNSMAFTLILQESATYDQGSSTVTVTHDHVIDEKVEFNVTLSPELGINQKLSFSIPDDAMHSFEAYRNKLDWYVRVKLDIPNFPDFNRNYKLKVLPEVADES